MSGWTGGRRLAALALLVTLLVAGALSYYASSHPDGLEFVAGEKGFLESGRDSVTSSGPLADYETRGVDDQRLSQGLAGVAGVALVLVLGGGLFWLLRSRDGAETGDVGPDVDGDGDDDGATVSPAGHDVNP